MRWWCALLVVAACGTGTGAEDEPVCRPFADWAQLDGTICSCDRCGPTAAEEDTEYIVCDDGWTLGVGSIMTGLDPEDYDAASPDLDDAGRRVDQHCSER